MSKDLFFEMRAEQNELNLFLQPKKEVAVLPVEDISLLTATKEDLSLMVSKIMEGIDDGLTDPLDLLILVKKGLFVFEALNESLKGKVSPPEEKDFKKHNATVKVQLMGVRYSYDQCNDSVWNDLNEKMKDISEKMKARQLKLKSLSKSEEVPDEVDEETGELIMESRTLYPPVKTGTETIVLGIK